MILDLMDCLPGVQGPRRRLLRRPARRAAPRPGPPRHRRRRRRDPRGRRSASTSSCQADLEQGLPDEVGDRLRRRRRGRRPRAPAQPDQLLREMGGRARPRAAGSSSRCPTSATGTRGPRTALGHLRLRPARHPRQDPPPVLHPPQPAADDQEERLRGEAPGDDRPPGRRRLGQALPVKRLVLAVDGLLVRLRPTLFAYQFVVEVEPVPPPRSVVWSRRKP